MTVQVDARKIIVQGDVNALVDTAKSLGTDLSRQLTTSQIRNIFGEVRRIEMNWRSKPPSDADEQVLADYQKAAEDGYRKVVLLQPKLAYQSKRERGQGVEMLQQALDPCITEIRNAPEARRREYFERFVDFFEAILAYHKAAGGN